jgi:hypothetical protein
LGRITRSDASSDTITRSFRFDLELSKVLDDEAEGMGISINALVGIIVKRYAEFTRYLSKIDMIVINREFITALLDSHDEQILYSMGLKHGENGGERQHTVLEKGAYRPRKNNLPLWTSRYV